MPQDDLMGQQLRNLTDDPSSARSVETTPAKVLLVDDNEELLGVLAEILRNDGLEVSVCKRADQALEELSRSVPDLIVSDVMMPDIDGYEFQKKVRASLDWCNIPFVFLSALGKAEEMRFAKQLGCDEYITKPFDPQDLLATIQGKLLVARDRNRLNEKRLDDYRRRVVHTLSHELRTPLVAINTGTELLLEQLDSLDERRIIHLLEAVQRGGQRLQRMIDDFMIVQQIDSGVAVASYKRLCKAKSMVEIVETAVDMFKDTWEGNEPEIRVAFDMGATAGFLISVYDLQVIDAVKRIIANAVKFGGCDKPIDIAVRRYMGSRDCVSVTVRDFGPGLPPEKLQRLGRLFTQIDRERMEQQGCGLGLTIANYFAELNGGKLEFHLFPEEPGLEVELRFPAIAQ